MSSNAMYFLLTQISNLTSTETQEVILCNWILISEADNGAQLRFSWEIPTLDCE